MDSTGDIIEVHSFITLTTAIIVLFVGKALNHRIGVLSWLNISVSVSGGLLVSLLLTAVYFVTEIEIHFDISARSYLIVYFLTSLGLGTRFTDLYAARHVVLVLLLAVVGFMALEDAIAVTAAGLSDDIGPEALLAGTVGLAGGSGSVETWSPTLTSEYGVGDARQIGAACAVLGLLLGSLAGGPVARYLTERNGLRYERPARRHILTLDANEAGTVDDSDFLRAVLVIHICAILGFGVTQLLAELGLAIPLYLACFLVAIGLTNLVPTLLPRLDWPSRTPAMRLIADLSLGILFGMSLISARIWTLVDLPAPLFLIVLIQLALTIGVTVLLLFPALGRDGESTVLCAGFVGLVLGSTATAMANMKAVAQKSGTAHRGFVIVPLVALFSVDAVNWALVDLFLKWFR